MSFEINVTLQVKKLLPREFKLVFEPEKRL